MDLIRSSYRSIVESHMIGILSQPTEFHIGNKFKGVKAREMLPYITWG